MKKVFVLLFLTLLFALPASAQVGSVSGLVTTEDREPAVNADVVIFIGERETLDTQTDDRGAFAFDEVPEGMYRIMASLEDVGTAWDDLEVTADENTEVHLVLEGDDDDDGVGSVSGLVTTEDREPAVNADVVIFIGERETLETQTDDRGAFAFDEVPEGNHRIMASLEDVGTAWDNLEVTADENTEIHLVLGEDEPDEFGSVSGLVTTEDREPAVNADVVVFIGERETLETQTDDRGAFAFDEVPAGRYHIAASFEELTAEDRLEVVADENTEINLVLEGRGGGDEGVGSVSGTVSNEDLEPVANADIILMGERRERFETQTNEDGAFAFEEVPAGWYVITATSGELMAEDRLEVTADENTEVHLVLEGDDDDDGVGSVSGLVTTEDSEPAVNADVVIFIGERETLETQTNEDGAFAFEEVPAGRYHIAASFEELAAEDRLEVIADENTEINLVLEGRGGGGGDREIGRVIGTVSTADEEPVVRAIVCLFRDARGRPEWVARTGTDREGAFAFERIPPGEYHITAELEDVGVAEADIEVNANEETEINLVLGEGELGPEYGVEEQDVNIPSSTTLLNAYPNPFNAVASIDFTLPTATNVTLSVFSVNGRLLQTLSNGLRTAGSHQITLNANSYPTGSYLIRLDTRSVSMTQQILLLK